MNTIDIILGIIILLVTWLGYKRGAAETILELVKWALSIACGCLCYYYTVDFAETLLPDLRQWYFPLVTALMFIITYLLLSMLQRRILRMDEYNKQKSVADKVSGIIPGLLMGIVISSITGRLLTFSIFDAVSKEAGKSEITSTFTPYTEMVEEQISPMVTTYFSPKIAAATTDQESAPDFKTETFFERPDLEYEMWLLVNEERRQHHLKPLAVDEKMKEVARAHSADMFTRGYFAHTTPEGVNPFQRMKQAKITYRNAGENLALAKTLEEAHRGLMNSPSHRAAILNPSFGRIGIGVLDGGKNGFMISQEFRN